MVTAITAADGEDGDGTGDPPQTPATSAFVEVIAFEGSGGRGMTRCPLVGVRGRPVG